MKTQIHKKTWRADDMIEGYFAENILISHKITSQK